MPPQLIFGTATFGMDLSAFTDPPSVAKVLHLLESKGIARLDCGARYPPRSPGRAEQLLGETSEVSHGFVIDTKVYVDVADRGGSLKKDAMEASVRDSLGRMKLDRVNVLYAHAEDPATPLDEQVAAFDEQIERGRCGKWGISNHSPDRVQEILRICEAKGLQKPSFYQGDYNLVTRGMEKRLLPVLRAHKVHFTAFRPLAAGFLTGNFINGETKGSRFSDANPIGQFARGVYSDKQLHDAMSKFNDTVKAHAVSPNEVALRWLMHHSALGEGDGIIWGASKIEQIQENMRHLGNGKLPDALVEVAEALWKAVEGTRGEIL